MIASPASANRRAAKRLKARGGVRVLFRKGTLGLGPGRPAEILDLSQTGVGLALEDPLIKGDEAEVEFKATALSRSVRVMVEVAWSLVGPDGRWRAGLRFKKPLDYSTWQMLT